MIYASKAKNTIKLHEGYFKTIVNWCKSNSFEFLPAKNITIALFLSNLDVNSYIYAIKWFHKIAALHDPCDSPFVMEIMEGVKRKHAKPVIKKEPLTFVELHKIYEVFGSSDNLQDLRVCALCFLGYSGFFRIQELLNLKIIF